MAALVPKILTRHDLTDLRGIERLEMTGGVLYRVCSEGGAVCRYTADLVRAVEYANQMRPERQNGLTSL